MASIVATTHPDTASELPAPLELEVKNDELQVHEGLGSSGIARLPYHSLSGMPMHVPTVTCA